MKTSSGITPTPDHQAPANILFLVPSLGTGGAEAQVVDLINGLDPSRFRPVVVCFENKIERLRDLRKEGLQFIHLPRQGKYDWTLPRRISAILLDREIQLIHCTLQIATLCGLVAGKISKQAPRVVGAVHNTIARNRRTRIIDKILYKRILQYCDATFFVCNEQLRYWKSEYSFSGLNAHVVHNGVDVDRFRPEWKSPGEAGFARLGIPEGAPVACCIAGFRPEKGHRILLEAFRKVVPVCGAHLLLAGEGIERPSIEAAAVADPELRGHVHFLGNLADVRPVIAASQFLVIPSTAVETFSIAMLESMAMERPVVATDIGGAREAVTSGVTGELIPANDVVQLAAALHRMFSDWKHCREMGLRARELVVERFDKKSMIDRIEGIFEGILLNPR